MSKIKIVGGKKYRNPTFRPDEENKETIKKALKVKRETPKNHVTHMDLCKEMTRIFKGYKWSRATGLHQTEVALVVSVYLELIIQYLLKGKDVRISGYGTFKLSRRRNQNTPINEERLRMHFQTAQSMESLNSRRVMNVKSEKEGFLAFCQMYYVYEGMLKLRKDLGVAYLSGGYMRSRIRQTNTDKPQRVEGKIRELTREQKEWNSRIRYRKAIKDLQKENRILKERLAKYEDEI